MRRSSSLVVLSSILACGTAHASSTTVSPAIPRAETVVGQSFLALGFDIGVGERARDSLLADVSFVHYPWLARPTSSSEIPLPKPWDFGIGAFALAGNARKEHARFAFGSQLNVGPFGVEAGASLDLKDGARATSVGAHLGLFISAAAIALAARWTVPLVSISAGAPYPGELGIFLVVKPGSFLALPMPR